MYLLVKLHDSMFYHLMFLGSMDFQGTLCLKGLRTDRTGPRTCPLYFGSLLMDSFTKPLMQMFLPSVIMHPICVPSGTRLCFVPQNFLEKITRRKDAEPLLQISEGDARSRMAQESALRQVFLPVLLGVVKIGVPAGRDLNPGT